MSCSSPPPPPNTVKRPKPGLRHYLLWLADQAKGFRCLVVSPLAASYMLGARIVTEDRTRQQGDRIGTWRNYPVYIDVSFSYGGGYFAENRGGVSLGHFTVYEDER